MSTDTNVEKLFPFLKKPPVSAAGQRQAEASDYQQTACKLKDSNSLHNSGASCISMLAGTHFF